MLSYVIKLFKKWQRHVQNNARQQPLPAAKPPREETLQDGLSPVLRQNLQKIVDVLGDGNDVKRHLFSFGLDFSMHGALVYIDGLVNDVVLRQGILEPLLSRDFAAKGRIGMPGILGFLKTSSLCSGDVVQAADWQTVQRSILNGDTVFFLDGTDQTLIISSKGWEKRSITEPQTAAVVRGPREGFVESLRSNTALLRRRLKTPDLRMELFTLGRQTGTEVCIVYLQGIVRPELLKTLRARLQAIDTDAILDSGYIEQYIEDSPLSVFPTVGASERPDTVAAKILEGRIAIIVDGSPFVLTVPYLFMEGFQDTADYYNRPFFGTIMRIIRYIAFFIAIFGPATFVAFTTFHPELIPTTLLLTVLKAREGTPFPAFLEALILVLAFEIIREAGLRLPRPIGQTISIVGALVMGEAAVSAGLVGAPMVIVVAITIVTTFIIPDTADPAVLMRMAMLVLASLMGGYGIALGFLALLVHLSTVSSFGMPYLAGIAPPKPGYAKDLFVRMPLWSMIKRPAILAGRNKIRGTYTVAPAGSPKGSAKDDFLEEDQ